MKRFFTFWKKSATNSLCQKSSHFVSKKWKISYKTARKCHEQIEVIEKKSISIFHLLAENSFPEEIGIFSTKPFILNRRMEVRSPISNQFYVHQDPVPEILTEMSPSPGIAEYENVMLPDFWPENPPDLVLQERFLTHFYESSQERPNSCFCPHEENVDDEQNEIYENPKRFCSKWSTFLGNCGFSNSEATNIETNERRVRKNFYQYQN